MIWLDILAEVYVAVWAHVCWRNHKPGDGPLEDVASVIAGAVWPVALALAIWMFATGRTPRR